MVKIEVYTLFDRTVATLSFSNGETESGSTLKPTWENIAYVQGEQLAHDEGGMLIDLLTLCVRSADMRAGENGGWSLLV